jgi:hypothetical protein
MRWVYRPIAQTPPSWIYLLVRAAPGADVFRAMTNAIWRVDPDQPVDGPWSIEDLERRLVGRPIVRLKADATNPSGERERAGPSAAKRRSFRGRTAAVPPTRVSAAVPF